MSFGVLNSVVHRITPQLHIFYPPPKKRENPNVPLGEVNVGLLADQVGVTTTNTLDLGQGDHDLLLAVNIGVEQTQDVLEVCLLVGHERYQITPSAFHAKIRHSTMKNPFSASSIFRFFFFLICSAFQTVGRGVTYT